MARKQEETKSKHLHREFVSDLLWKVIEKVEDESNKQHVRETFRGAHRLLLDKILEKTKTFDLNVVSEIADELSEEIFRSISQGTSNKYVDPEVYYETFSKHMDSDVTRPVKVDTSERKRRGTQKQRKQIIRNIFESLILKAEEHSFLTHSPDKWNHAFSAVFPVVWDEIKDMDFVIFPKMEEKLSSDIFDLLCGNEILLELNLFYLMSKAHPMVVKKIISCFKMTLSHPRKVHFNDAWHIRVWKATKKWFRSTSINSILAYSKVAEPEPPTPKAQPETTGSPKAVGGHKTSELLQETFPEPEPASLEPVECVEAVYPWRLNKVSNKQAETVVSYTPVVIHVSPCNPTFEKRSGGITKNEILNFNQ
ncbi:uncharacterized protein LOC110366501 [Fundulus heteroclitus]|uniref:uncharacterized protein LOC110366501 n=1 Tax=Fundulus heteroclitus TaxID=8078 RepID=UPI00165C96B0|nr:uncharacterized protein LOC110366501 [Fundulus heteroclitus]